MSLSEAERERIIDSMVMRRLRTDREYRNAEDADAQAEREREITEACERHLAARYDAGTVASEYHTGNQDDWPYRPY